MPASHGALPPAVGPPPDKDHTRNSLKVILRPSAHNPMKGVDSVGDAQVGLEQGINLAGIGKVGAARYYLPFGGLGGGRGLDNVGEDEPDVWGERVGQKRASQDSAKPSTSASDKDRVGVRGRA